MRAIFEESRLLPPAQRRYIAVNAERAKVWAIVSEKLAPLPETGKWAQVTEKLTAVELA